MFSSHNVLHRPSSRCRFYFSNTADGLKWNRTFNQTVGGMIARRNRREKRYAGGAWFIGKKKCHRWRSSSYCVLPLHFSSLPVPHPYARPPETFTDVNFILYILHHALSVQFSGFSTRLYSSHSTTRGIYQDWPFIFHSFSLILTLVLNQFNR